MTHCAIVAEQAPPALSRLADWYDDADLLDSYAVDSSRASGSIRAIAGAILGSPAPWFIRALRSVRAGAESQLWHRKSDGKVGADPEQDNINSLPVLLEHDAELILGKDNRHMSFRILIMRERSDCGRDLVSVTTAVRCHTTLGHVLLAVVKPFHRLLVPLSLRRGRWIWSIEEH
ncbi:MULTISPECIES: DUF2867 domain-containing protein [Rhizobium/Agrobacterium group]|uniref:DUF2867 domain-containing protein n=1 Tax=Rhizobium/Agrobacterium group TaxID=227290 RepID=UPI000618754E|nr:hypothetical protein Ach5_48580 [Agrobacterium tumefaciens]AYM20004.1 hypothetical protein At15955_50190 [Agrobacterium tumefaciens]AYM71307.1 hypothetical protein AtA6_50910 [Agrobacterium tumefaciens]NIB59699.1 DUF2867 domain-containing protein [Agrobacterium tumefaciens]NSZ25124.1 DUF2867 domain-containing protein [Agrobacterium tumefaciens]